MPDHKTRVRWARDDDEKDFLRMSGSFAMASPYKGQDTNDEKLSDLFHRSKGSPSRDMMLLLVTVDDRPVGMLFAVATELFFSKDRIASEIMLWVDPDYRSRTVVNDLVGAFEYWAKNIAECPMTVLAALEDDTLPAVSRLYRSLEYLPREHQFIKVM